MNWLEVVGTLANAATISGVGFVVWQMRRDRSYASASIVLTICSNIRSSIEEVGRSASADMPSHKTWEHSFRNLLNELELASAIVLDKAASGRSGKIAERFLIDILKHINGDLGMKSKVSAAIHQETTFVNLRDFLRKHRADLQ
ncbi:hypothetical protein G8E10_04835 [Rhizobiaceae bacterium CRRU44]|uniref:DUF4760 domain-containing protein n=1 Tax=Ferranicluibacter rubi TaxID=2715133 RepID=A0AA43ZDW4_9HYPH|nr:hypothetical protein [Ferranicluibacter rubi]NHT75082.1 hypothetical protein [Ferranicluibacter rubi]